MIDFILGLFLAALVVRGWLRGLVREVLDLVGLVAGIWVAFSLSRPVGDFLTESFGVSPEAARIGAGVALFILFGATLGVLSHYLSKLMRLPGLNIANRLGGAAVAVGWGVVLVLVLVSVAGAAPLPDKWVTAINESVVVESIAGDDALPQRMFRRLTGDDVMGSLATIRGLFGTPRAVPEGDEVLEIPPAEADELVARGDEAREVLTLINEFRAGEGLRALESAEVLARVAEERAWTMYTSGRLSRETPPGVTVADALEAAGARLAFSGEAIALAGTARGALDGILASESGLAEMTEPNYDRAGVAVIDGPTGRLLVVVLGG
ncbi:MAG: CvpA family protein [Acidimicrobiia bacterium]